VSIERLCDCPVCHGYDEVYGVINGDDYEVIGGMDICRMCLDGSWGCTYWQVRVKPELTQWEIAVRDIWSPVILYQLEAGARLRDWDKFTENRIKHITITKYKERERASDPDEEIHLHSSAPLHQPHRGHRGAGS
jgi:hypothetical protein